MRLLESDGQEIRVVDVEEIISREPALTPSRAQIAGGILCPPAETGDSPTVTRALAATVEARGGKIIPVTRLTPLPRRGHEAARILSDQRGGGRTHVGEIVHRER